MSRGCPSFLPLITHHSSLSTHLPKVALEHGKRALAPEILLVESEQVRYVGRRLRGQAVLVHIAQSKRGLAHQAQRQGVCILAGTGQEAEQSVDSLDRHPFGAKRPQAEAR